MTTTPEMADYPHQVTEDVRFSETDMMGHVNNTVFGQYFEIGRSTYFSENGFYAQEGVGLVIVRIEMQFLGMIFWPGKIEIGTRVAGSGNSSFQMEQVLRQDDRIVGSANCTMVVIDPASNKSMPIPDQIRVSLKL